MAYITTENTAATLSHKMDSIGLHVSQDLQPGRFQIFSLELSSSDPHPEFSMENMAYGIERLPSQYEVIIVDSITDVAADCQDRAIKSFFSRCKRLCSNGRTIILTIHPDIFEDKLLTRLRALCDAQLSLSVERQGEKLLNVMEVRKVHNAKLDTGNVVSFEIRPEIGIRIVPIRNVRA